MKNKKLNLVHVFIMIMNITTKVFLLFPLAPTWRSLDHHMKPPCILPAKILAKCEGQEPLNKVHISYNSELMADGKTLFIA